MEGWQWTTLPGTPTTDLANLWLTPPPLWMPRTRQVYVLGGEVWQIPPPPKDPPSSGSGLRPRAPEVILRKAANHVGQVPKATHRETKTEAQ